MIELYFAILGIGGTLVFLYATRKRTNIKSRKTKAKPQKKKEQKNKDSEGIPESWRKEKTNNPGPSHSFSFPKPTIHKFHLPGLRSAKRFTAAILLVANFLISQGCLLSAPASQPMFWLFIFNAFILLDYLWKTRRST